MPRSRRRHRESRSRSRSSGYRVGKRRRVETEEGSRKSVARYELKFCYYLIIILNYIAI